MAYIYMVEDNRGDFSLIKVGYASDVRARVHLYVTHNPMAVCFSHIKTYSKTGRTVEHILRNDLVRMGGTNMQTCAGSLSEWVKVEHNQPIYNVLMAQGINALPNGKHRKNLGGITYCNKNRGRKKKGGA